MPYPVPYRIASRAMARPADAKSGPGSIIGPVLANNGLLIMAAILYVRIKSDLDFEELERRLRERLPRFLDVPGLVQKMYGRDPATGNMCGIYFFEDTDSLAAFRDSELAKTIPTAYEATDVRREVYEVMFPLYADRGPLPAS